MSRKRQQYNIAEFLAGLPWGAHKYDNQQLSERDNSVFNDAACVWLCMLCDLLCVGKDSDATRGRIKVLSQQLVAIDVASWLKFLKAVTNTLLKGVEDKSLRQWDRFKADVAQGACLSKPETLFLGLIRKHADDWKEISDFQTAYQAAVFLSRTNFEFEGLEETAFEKWWQSEVQCAVPRDYKSEEAEVISEWFPVENLAVLREWYIPVHGSGSTAERVSQGGEKAFLNGTNRAIDTMHLSLGVEDTSSLQQPWYINTEVGNMAEMLFVPKNWSTYRGVNMEPVGMMFHQQGAMYSIYQYLKAFDKVECGLRRHYCVDTEHKNRELAQVGSINGTYATIDLSAASDSVSDSLVKEWFDNSCLRHYVEYLRTPYVRYKNKMYGTTSIYRLDKFAPMGSALCFPIESIVFAAIVEVCLRHTPGANPHYRVYGDDIVCDVRLVPELLERLRRFGFTPNVDKSFYNDDPSSDFFRESCGGEYLNGFDITPIRISRKFAGFSCLERASIETINTDDETSSSIAQLIQLCNDLRALPTARTFVLSRLLKTGLPLLFDGGEAGIATSQPTNFHLQIRYNCDYQRLEVKALIIQTERKGLCYHEDSYLSEVRLYTYLAFAERSARHSLLFPEDLVDVRMDPYATKLRARVVWRELPEVPREPLL